MRGSSIKPMPGCAPKINCAIGTPDAKVFFEPQNTAVILSSSEKPRRRLIASDIRIARKKIAVAPAKVQSNTRQPWLDHTPPTTESQKEV
jgi:hypothetical protein